MKKILSILIPTYNRLAYLKDKVAFFDSVAEENIEIIISNNCSKDGTREFLEGIDPKFVVYNQSSNVGLVNNILFLISKSTGEYIWIVGDDDKLLPGCVDKILSIITRNSVGHVFMNYAVTKNGVISTKKRYVGKERIYENGEEMFLELANEAGFGALMFITANIFKKKRIDEFIEIMKKVDELDNIAFPLGFSYYCSLNESGYVCSSVYIHDEYATISWSQSAIKLQCRDMIAILAKTTFGDKKKEINKLILNNLPHNAPEFYYSLYGSVYHKDNYALKWMLKEYPLHIISDFFIFFAERMSRLYEKIIGR